MRRPGPVFATLAIAAAGLVAVAAAGWISPSELFRRNAELKAEGYWMAEFEFKMLAALHHLNEGRYREAHRTLRRIRREMKTREGLVKVPPNASTEELIAFHLARQNPETGAFIDPSYPLFAYIAPTANVLEELERLATRTGRPVRVRYPLRFLDRIRTPEQLRAYLDSLLYFQERWVAVSGGPTPYVAGVSELSARTVERFESLGGYRFPAGWKEELLRWLHETQDPVAGFWGARIGKPGRWRSSPDLDSTAHVLGNFLGNRGEVLDPRYPPRHVEPLARNVLKELSRPLPEDADEQHAWSLRQANAMKVLVRLLWPSLPGELRQGALAAMPQQVEGRFAFYRPLEGGFAVDSRSSRADVDATRTALTFLVDVGWVPGTWRRERLRSEALAAPPGIVASTLARWDDASLAPDRDVNSLRVYREVLPSPESLDDAALVRVVYPRETTIPDVMDLRQGLARYLAAEGGEFGNWSSKASLEDTRLALDRPVRPVPMARGRLDLAAIAREHPGTTCFFVVGVDRFQLPVFRTEYRLSSASP